METVVTAAPQDTITRIRCLLARQFRISPDQISPSDTVETLIARHIGPPNQRMKGKYLGTRFELEMTVFLVDIEDEFALEISDDEFDEMTVAKNARTIPEIADRVERMESTKHNRSE